MIERNHNGRKPVTVVREKTIGWIENGVFYKEVNKEINGSKHQLKKTAAWSIDAEAFDKQIKPYATELVIINTVRGTKFRVSVEKFDSLKQELDRSYGKQYYLSPAYWEIETNGISVVQVICDF